MSTWTVIAAVAGLLAGQSFWIAHALAEVSSRLDRIDAHLDRIETTVLRDHGERIARLEERTGS